MAAPVDNPKGYFGYSASSMGSVVLQGGEKQKFYYFRPDEELSAAIEKVNLQLTKINGVNLKSLSAVQELKDLSSELFDATFVLTNLRDELRANDQWISCQNWLSMLKVVKHGSDKLEEIDDRIEVLEPRSP